MIEIGNPKNAGNAGLSCPTPRVAGERQSARSPTVVRAIARADFVPAGDQPRDANRVFVGFGATVGEEKRVDIAGRYLSELLSQARAHVGGHEWICVGEPLCLFLDGPNHTLVAVADVDAHQLAIEVDEALAFRGPEIDAFGALDWDWVNRRLR